MIGVIAGIYLTNYFEKRRLVKDKGDALEKVFLEIERNEENLSALHDLLRKKYTGLDYIMQYLNVSEEEVIIPKDSLEVFKLRARDIFSLKEVETHGSNELSLYGDLELEFEPGSAIIMTGLSDVVWEGFKSKNFLQVTELNCISNLEDIYEIQKVVDVAIEEWFDQFLRGICLVIVKQLSLL